MKIVFPLFSSLFFCVHFACAQQYLFTRYTPKDGLVSNRARFMFQDSKGRLYISTFGGLSVYDGSRFINYTTENGLATSLINDIVEMGEDSLWIVPNGSALHCMVHGVIKDLRTADHFYPVINQLFRCSDGRLYAFADEGFFWFDRDRFVRIPLTDEKGRNAAQLLSRAVEKNGRLFIMTDPGLGTYPGSANLLMYDLHSGKLTVPEKSLGVYALTKSPEGDVLVSTLQGVRRLDTTALLQNILRFSSLPFPYQAADTLSCAYMYFDRSLNFWFSTATQVVKIDRTGKKTVFGPSNGLPAGITHSIFEDAEENMWFINEQNGITKLVNQQAAFYSQIRPGFTVTDLYADGHSDSAWFYDASQRSLLLLTGNTEKIFHGDGDLPAQGQIVIGQHSYMTSENRIYSLRFSADGKFHGSLIHPHVAGNEPMDKVVYAYAFPDNNGDLILSSDKLSILHGDNLLQTDIHYLSDQAAMDKYQRIWTVTRTDELSVYRRDRTDTGNSLQLLHRYMKELPRVGPRSIAVDKEERVWIGTRDHGLYCLSFDSLRLISIKQLTIKDGLSENWVDYLQCDPDNTIWACTPAGLDMIRVEKGRFTINNITRSNATYQTIYKVISSGQGMHWALVQGGMIRVSTATGKKNGYQPQLLFSEIIAGNEPVTDPRQQVRLPYDRNALSFSVGASTFIDETQTRYTYLLQGSNTTKWSVPSEQSTINFVNLPPGKYTLRVKAQFLTGRYPDQSAAYAFLILPPWWQTWWFRTAAICLLLGLCLLWIRSYVRRKLDKQRVALEKRQAVEKERTRIATDMHDDLGAGLSRIKFLSETIGIKKQQQLSIEEEISGIHKYSHEMIDKMGEIVWALNEKNDSLSDLLSYTRSYAAEYLMQAGIRCKLEAPDELPSLAVSGEFRRNVYLTIKEALHNIVKHAQAGNVFIGMEVGEKLIITIKDDGVGFTKDRIRPFSNGLTNMEKRIREIGGTLVILHGNGATAAGRIGSGITGSGITVRLSVPV